MYYNLANLQQFSKIFFSHRDIFLAKTIVASAILAFGGGYSQLSRVMLSFEVMSMIRNPNS
jgi:hypothetical protein